MAINNDLETSKLLVQAVGIMVPLLVAFATIYVAGVAIALEKLGRKLHYSDTVWIVVISTLGVLSLGFWALALAGAICSTSGRHCITEYIPNEYALPVATKSMAIGYTFFVFLLLIAGIYFYRISKELLGKRRQRLNQRTRTRRSRS